MFWKQKKAKRYTFILLEVVIALILALSFTPNLLKDQNLCRKEIDKLAFYDQLENEYKKLLFNLYYDLHEKYYEQMTLLDKDPWQHGYEKIEVLGKNYPCRITLQRHEIKEGKTLQVSALLEVYDLPYQIHIYHSEPQHYSIHKVNL